MPVCDLKKLFPDVQEDGDFLVFRVRSSRPTTPEHRVDLQKFCGGGHCTCERFTFHLHKLLRNGAMPTSELECKHIKRARRYLAFKVISGAILEREKQADKNKKGSLGTSRPRPESWPADDDIPL